MEKFIEKIVKNAKIKIKNTEYIVKTKTWYSIEEDENNIISLGILPDKSNERADVFAERLSLQNIEI